MAKLVSKAYADALFEIAMEGKKSDLFLQEAQDILTTLEQNPQFNKLMKHPKVSVREKEQIIDEVFQNRISKEMASLIKLLIYKERYDEIFDIFLCLTERIKQEKKIGVALVTTAVELTQQKKAAIEKHLLDTTPYKSMEVHFEVEQMIIGGIIIRMKDRVMDNSVRTRLEELKKQLLQIQIG